MSNDTKNTAEFWTRFKNKDFSSAQEAFSTLDSAAQQTLLAELYEKSQYQQTPAIISVLQRDLHADKTFDDFYQAWLPPAEYCKPTEQNTLQYKQHFPAPTRVINATNLANPDQIISVGLTWFQTPEQAEAMKAFATGKDTPSNQERADSIETVAKRISSNVFLVQSDDNLGVPF